MNLSTMKRSAAAPAQNRNYSIRISAEEAYLLFAKWRESEAKLHVAFFGRGNRVASPGTIVESYAKEESIVVLVATDAPSNVWSVPLHGARFSYCEPMAMPRFPQYSDGKWAAYLTVEMPNGFSALFAEREAPSL